MKILHVIPSISDRSGGPAHVIFPMCRALQKRGLTLAIATTSHDVSDKIPDADTGQNGTRGRLNPNDRKYSGISTYFFPTRWGDSFKYSRPLATWLSSKVKDFDVVHIHAVFNHACLAAARACYKHGVPYVVRPLGTLDPWSMRQKPLRKKLFWLLAGRRMLHRASAIHYTAQGERDAAEQLLRLSRGKVIPLGIEVSQAPLGSQPCTSIIDVAFTHRPYVLVLSRLHAKKGLDVLIEAFLELSQRKAYSHWRLVLAGDGDAEYVKQLKQKVAVRHAEDLIVFPGWLAGEEKSTVLRDASLVALPSYQENFGLCVIEALANGIPVLVSPQVNLAEDIEAAAAGWVSSVDPVSLEACLAEALGDEDERLRRGSAGKTFSLNFNWNKIAEDLEHLYKSIASPDRS